MPSPAQRLAATGAVAAALAGVAFLLLRDRPTDEAPTDAAASSKKEKMRPAVLAAEGRNESSAPSGSDAPKAAAAGAATPLPAFTYRGPLHVHGRVIAPPEVAFTGDARVHLVVVHGEQASGTVVERAPVNAFGAFDFHAKADAAVTLLRVVATVPGFVTATADATPTADGDVPIDVPLATELSRGWTLSAKVVDAAGKPVAGLPVAAGADPDEGDCVPLERLDASRVMGAGDDGVASGLRGTAITDDRGLFSVRGLCSGGCTRVRSLSPEWMIVNDASNASLRPGEPSTLHARAAGVLDLTVVDDRGAPVKDFEVNGVSAGGSTFTATGRNGRLRVQWPRAPGEPAATSIDVAVVFLMPFMPETRTIANGAATEIRLRRATRSDQGRLVVTRSGAGAESLPEFARTPSVLLRRRGSPLVVAATDGSITGPAGSWEYEIALGWRGSEALRQRGTVVLSPDRVAEILWEIPPLGMLVLTGGREGAGVLLQSAGRPDVRSTRGASPWVLPVGTWSVSLLDEAGGVAAHREGVEVKSGEHVIVTLDPKGDGDAAAPR